MESTPIHALIYMLLGMVAFFLNSFSEHSMFPHQEDNISGIFHLPTKANGEVRWMPYFSWTPRGCCLLPLQIRSRNPSPYPSKKDLWICSNTWVHCLEVLIGCFGWEQFCQRCLPILVTLEANNGRKIAGATSRKEHPRWAGWWWQMMTEPCIVFILEGVLGRQIEQLFHAITFHWIVSSFQQLRLKIVKQFATISSSR